MNEKRRFPRFKQEYGVVVKVLYCPAASEMEGKTFFCRTENVSAGGILLYATTQLPPRAMLDMRIAMPNARLSVELNGMVAWTGATVGTTVFPVGVEFTGGKGDDLQTWRDTACREILS